MRPTPAPSSAPRTRCLPVAPQPKPKFTSRIKSCFLSCRIFNRPLHTTMSPAAACFARRSQKNLATRHTVSFLGNPASGKCDFFAPRAESHLRWYLPSVHHCGCLRYSGTRTSRTGFAGSYWLFCASLLLVLSVFFILKDFQNLSVLSGNVCFTDWRRPPKTCPNCPRAKERW